MANSLSPVQSTPIAGLGTQVYTVTAATGGAGLYTCSVNISIPWTTSDQPYARANPQANEVQTITAVADSSGSLNSTYWTFFTPGNAVGYYVWYNINSAGVDPAPAGLTGIAVVGATNASATTLGGATRTAIGASTAATYFTVTGATTATILTAKQPGAMTAAANSVAASPGFTYAVGTTGSFGYGSGLVITVTKNTGTPSLTLSQPTPTQPFMAGSVQISCALNDTINVALTSLSVVDQVANSVKGIINCYFGQGA